MEGNEPKNVREVLEQLAQPSNVAVHSSDKLLGEVEAVAAKDDEEREQNQLDALRRKPGLRPVPPTRNSPRPRSTPTPCTSADGRTPRP
ncbi:hypothetical protein ACFC26_24090 [Kitasatospora purpeofusca]|uniref:hypothetical protein n=1 Tax=Kitasatospora purpeofusca TaxID=67352 RepID=UPI0035E38080